VNFLKNLVEPDRTTEPFTERTIVLNERFYRNKKRQNR